MNNRNRLLVAAAVVGGALILLGMFFFASKIKPSNQDAKDPLKTTRMNSPLTRSSDELAVNYFADAGNISTVKQPFRIFALSSLPFDASTRAELETIIPAALRREVVPTYAAAYVHIDRRTIACVSTTECRFSMYIDSPEAYFTFHIFHDIHGSLGYDIKPQAWTGITQ